MSSISSDVKDGEGNPPVGEQPAPAPNVPGPKPRGAFSRFIDWFWCGSAFRELQASRRIPSARSLELNRRAHAALELGRFATEPTRAVEHGPHDALGCDLFAQSIYWSLAAQESLHSAGAAASAEPSERASLQSLWQQADRSELERATGGDAAAVQELEREVVGRSFVDYAELGTDEQARLARSLRSFAEALLERLDGAEQALERLWFRRLFRISIPAVALAVLVVAALYGVDRMEQARDIARQKPWVASSRWPEGGCLSPAQECPGSPMYFFSTTEEDSPSVEFDLGSVQPISGFSITNRKDCCTERAVPLVVEVSTDHKNYKEVARQTDVFKTWKGSFATTNARWVRLRVARRSFLHLASVRLFR